MKLRRFVQRILRFVLPFLFTISYGQELVYPTLNKRVKHTADFVPVGWQVLDSAAGDVNKDGETDVALVLQRKKSLRLLNEAGDTVFTQPRILLMAFANPADKSYLLAAQSNSFILKNDDPSRDDPFQGLAIKNGVLQISFQLFYNSGSWYITNAVYTFRYQKGGFILIGADKSSFHRASHDFEEYSYNFLTGKRRLRKGNDEKGTAKVISKNMTVSPLKTLKTFTGPFTWEVEKDVYL